MPDDPDVVRRAFQLDADPPHVRPPSFPRLPALDPPPLPASIVVVPARFVPAPIEPPTQEQFDEMVSIVRRVHDVLVEFARALGAALRSIVEQFQRAFPAPLLVQLVEGERYVRRMEAHWHRTAGRPRSRMRPGRTRRRGRT